MPMTTPLISIILPAFNERESLAVLLPPLLEQALLQGWQVIVIDDGSTDRTGEVAASLGATVVRHASNRGYGAALKTGIRAADAPLVAIMDADGQHTLEALAAVLSRADAADVVI